jgi:hypothetical protein
MRSGRPISRKRLVLKLTFGPTCLARGSRAGIPRKAERETLRKRLTTEDEHDLSLLRFLRSQVREQPAAGLRFRHPGGEEGRPRWVSSNDAPAWKDAQL